MTFAVNIAQGGSNNTTMRNRIINGAMVIDQRNAGAEVNPAVSGSYYLDRWQVASTAASKFKIGRNAGSVTPPAGFSNYLGCTSLSAYSVGASEVFHVRQTVEANNVADLAWGTANAAGVTLSFWVYSSLIGTFGGAIRNASTYNYSYPFTYSVSAANTWEYKTVSIPGPTAGTWGTGTSAGLELGFSLGSGSTLSGTAGAWAAVNYTSATGAVSVVGTSGATFYITGVQLEAGTTASPFEYRQYGTELALCQRYCQTIAANFSVGYSVSSAVLYSGGPYVFPTTMRIAPTLTGGAYTVNTGSAGTVGIWYSSTNSVNLLNSAANWTVGAHAFVSTGAILSSEL